MNLTYFIDGYNVIHFCGKLRPLANRDLEGARAALIERIAPYLSAKQCRAVVVFDGRSPHARADSTQHAPDLEVCYSNSRVTADAIIERRVYRLPDRGAACVVTADGGMRAVCRGMGAFVMSPDNFLATLREARACLTQDTARSRSGVVRYRLEDHLNEASRDRLRQLRGRL